MKLETESVHYAARAAGRRVWIGAMVAGCFTLPFAGSLDHSYGSTKSLAMLLCVGVSFAAVFMAIHTKTPDRGKVKISEEGVDYETSRLARSEIRSAQFSPAVRGRRASVRFLGTGDRELGYVTVKDHAEANNVLRALGLPPEASIASFYAMADIGWLPVAFLSMLLAALGGWVGSKFFVVPQLAYLGILPVLVLSAFILPGRLHVGADGLLWKTRLDPTFFAWKDVERVMPNSRGISVVLKNGQSVRIPTVQYTIRHEYQRVTQAALITRANDAIAAYRAGAVPDVTARVARLGRTKEEWVAQLQDREGNFREAPLRTDDLWRVVESPAATATARAGAAAVLAREASDEDRARLRVAADVCAEPRLRVVLDKAASGEDPTDALGDVEDAEDARAARA